MSDAAYKRWVNTEWWHEGYERLWQARGGAPQSEVIETDPSVKGDKGNPEETVTPEDNLSGSESQTSTQQNVIYLTADSEEELTELKPEEIYIIGGICDHNRYKVATPPYFHPQKSILYLISLILESLPQ